MLLDGLDHHRGMLFMRLEDLVALDEQGFDFRVLDVGNEFFANQLNDLTMVGKLVFCISLVKRLTFQLGHLGNKLVRAGVDRLAQEVVFRLNIELLQEGQGQAH